MLKIVSVHFTFKKLQISRKQLQQLKDKKAQSLIRTKLPQPVSKSCAARGPCGGCYEVTHIQTDDNSANLQKQRKNSPLGDRNITTRT